MTLSLFDVLHVGLHVFHASLHVRIHALIPYTSKTTVHEPCIVQHLRTLYMHHTAHRLHTVSLCELKREVFCAYIISCITLCTERAVTHRIMHRVYTFYLCCLVTPVSHAFRHLDIISWGEKLLIRLHVHVKMDSVLKTNLLTVGYVYQPKCCVIIYSRYWLEKEGN